MSDKDILNKLLLGGIIGASLGALISKNKYKGGSVGAIAGAVLVATFQANERAEKLQIPICRVENGNLLKIYPDGRKEFLKKIDKPNIVVPNKFILK